jgi:3-oxoacyl-[acyl-carrier-protein] synthase II
MLCWCRPVACLNTNSANNFIMNTIIPTSNRRVVITGLGAVTPVGNSAKDTWAALAAGRSGIAKITRFDPTGCNAQIAGEVKNFDPTRLLDAPLHPRGLNEAPLNQVLTQKDVKKFGRFTHLGSVAAVEAYADSGLDAHRAELNSERMGVNLGVGLGGLPEMEAMHDTWKTGGYRKISPFFIIQIAPNLLAGEVSLLLDFKGPNMSVASACATSGHAMWK